MHPTASSLNLAENVGKSSTLHTIKYSQQTFDFLTTVLKLQFNITIQMSVACFATNFRFWIRNILLTYTKLI